MKMSLEHKLAPKHYTINLIILSHLPWEIGSILNVEWKLYFCCIIQSHLENVHDYVIL